MNSKPEVNRSAEVPVSGASVSGMNPSYWLGWHAFRLLFAIYFRWRVFHPERIPASGPVILASNHASFLDPPLIGACSRRAIHYLARDTLFRFPGFAQLLHSWNTVPVDREGGGAAGIKAILNVLQAAGAIVVFPEGTRTSDGRLRPARSGVGLLIIKSGASVVPVRVLGTYEAFGRQVRFPKPHRVTVKFGEPLRFDPLQTEAQTSSKARLKEIYQQIANEVMAHIAALEPSAEDGHP
jgi:1-acyl-sn-glycerol-3-phosphate acyltransferase